MLSQCLLELKGSCAIAKTMYLYLYNAVNFLYVLIFLFYFLHFNFMAKAR